MSSRDSSTPRLDSGAPSESLDKYLVFSPLLEQLFVRRLGPRLLARTRDELRGLGIDLDRPLLPAYPWEVVENATEVVARQLYPTLCGSRSGPGGIAQSSVFEVIGEDTSHGVVDEQLRVFGCTNMIVCDAAALPANPGVNPALTMTALAEYAMSHVPVDEPR